MSMHYKAALFDADGVTILAPRPYSRQHAEIHSLDPEKLEAFFGGDFQLALRGQADLKELITKHADIWQPSGDPQLILDMWFEAENFPNRPLLGLIQQLRRQGLPSFLTTDQEKYRADYLQNTMFNDEFDGMFISSNIGATKRDPEFFPAVIAQLQTRIPGIQPQQIVYFDDSQRNIDTAKAADIDAWLYESPEQVQGIC